MSKLLNTYNHLLSIVKNRIWIVAFLVVILLGSIVLRFHLLSIPLERDEGEYAYAGQLILQGIPPYEQVYSMKLPGVYFIYALILCLFGESPTAIHTGLLVVNLMTILLLFFFTRKLFDEPTALASAAALAILSVNPFVHGVFAHAEHFVILFVLSSLLILLYSWDSDGGKEVFLSGFFAGIACLMKQQALSFAGLALAALLMVSLFKKDKTSKKLFLYPLIFLMGLATPLLITGIYFYLHGLGEKFLFWTFSYAREYISTTDPLSALTELKRKITLIFNYASALWLLGAVGAMTLFSSRIDIKNRLFVVLFFVFSCLAVTPGFYFREHYFIMILPAVSLLTALSFRFIHEHAGSFIRTSRFAPAVLILTLTAGASLFQMQDYLFKMSPMAAIRLTHSLNPFPESLPIAAYIKENSAPTDKIAIIGSEPQIYFYAQRRGATGFIYMYPLMENHKFALVMQEQMIREIETAKPRYLVFVHIPTSWLGKESSYDLVFRWFNAYAAEHYIQRGLVEIRDYSTTFYHWGKEAATYKPLSPLWVSIHERDSFGLSSAN